MIDLHVHTTMSDGTLSPVDVVRLAHEKGLKAIAITDHDTVAGVGPAKTEGDKIGVEVVSGVEISAQWKHGILHILGYFLNPEHPALLDSLTYLKRERIERIPKIVSRLNDHGIAITVEAVEREAKGGVPGRPHVANVLLNMGNVGTLQEAFDLYLRKGAPAYVKKVKIPPVEAIRLIAGARGVPVVAHPYSLGVSDPDHLEQILSDLKGAGLEGLEVFYPEHSPEETGTFLKLARKLDLVATGGTDFHGSNKPGVKLGELPDRPALPYSLLADLKARKTALAMQAGRGRPLVEDDGSQAARNVRR